ncbi:UNVERIFIED_CONTAM: VanZ family protein [Acetivibrio alkalicellulosi]
MWILAVLCMFLILRLSSEPAQVSKEKSGFILEKIEPIIERLEETFQINIVNKDKLHFYIRKHAHVFIYFLLSILLTLSWKAFGAKGLKPYYFTWIMATVFSIIDETYQSFIPGRSGELRDVLLDNIGINLGLLLVLLLSKNSFSHKRNGEKKY